MHKVLHFPPTTLFETFFYMYLMKHFFFHKVCLLNGNASHTPVKIASYKPARIVHSIDRTVRQRTGEKKKQYKFIFHKLIQLISSVVVLSRRLQTILLNQLMQGRKNERGGRNEETDRQKETERVNECMDCEWPLPQFSKRS